MVFSFFRSQESPMAEVEDRIHQMLIDGRSVYDTAMEAVFGGGKSKETKAAVKGTDHEINVGQRDVRRALLIHASVAPASDTARVLSYMSVIKDVERIGDYSKNLYDLAKYGVDFEAASDHEELAAYRDRVGQLISDAAEAFRQRDMAKAEALVAKANDFLDDYDANVKAAYRSEGPASDAVSRALYFRFLKRITAHVMNFLTALVLPLDQLDYYDEPSDED
jgi:phosphate uptake regulator